MFSVGEQVVYQDIIYKIRDNTVAPKYNIGTLGDNIDESELTSIEEYVESKAKEKDFGLIESEITFEVIDMYLKYLKKHYPNTWKEIRIKADHDYSGGRLFSVLSYD